MARIEDILGRILGRQSPLVEMAQQRLGADATPDEARVLARMIRGQRRARRAGAGIGPRVMPQRVAAPSAGATGGAAAPVDTPDELPPLEWAYPKGNRAQQERERGMYEGQLRENFLQALARGDENALAYANAGAPKINPFFAHLVAQENPATLAFIEDVKRRRGL